MAITRTQLYLDEAMVRALAAMSRKDWEQAKIIRAAVRKLRDKGLSASDAHGEVAALIDTSADWVKKKCELVNALDQPKNKRMRRAVEEKKVSPRVAQRAIQSGKGDWLLAQIDAGEQPTLQAVERAKINGKVLPKPTGKAVKTIITATKYLGAAAGKYDLSGVREVQALRKVLA